MVKVFRVGVLACLALGVGCKNRDTGDRPWPPPAELPHPKPLWSVSGLHVTAGSKLPTDPAGRLFLFDRSRHVPFAVNAKTGRRVWTAEEDPALPVAPPKAHWDRYFYLSLADDVLVLDTQGYVAAYRTDDGKRLSSRPVPEFTEIEAQGHHLKLARGKNGLGTHRIVIAATGEEVAVVEPGLVRTRVTNSRPSLPEGRNVTLGRDVVLVADNGTKLEARPLRASLPSWRVEMPPVTIDDGRSWVPVLYVDGVFVWFGGPMIALDESTGRRLWERPVARDHEEIAAGNMLLVLEGATVVKLAARSGVVRERYAVPSLPDRRADYDLLAAGDRVALVESDSRKGWTNMFSETQPGYVVMWTGGARAPVVLIRPAKTDVFAMVGDVLLAAASDEGQLFAVDLERHEVTRDPR